jgi:hypothetical protein
MAGTVNKRRQTEAATVNKRWVTERVEGSSLQTSAAAKSARLR